MNVNYARAYFQESSDTLPHIEFRIILENDTLENTIGRYGNGGRSGVGLRSNMKLHELITKPPFTGKWISNTRWGIKSRVNISSLDAPNAPNRRAHTVNVIKEDLSVLIDLLFIF